MNGGFRRQCASALTHPVTVGALVVLLVNDLVLKALWPDQWATGKLSDLAWVVFASPLLAFLLSFLTQGKRWAERGAFGAAYVGLPLLYAGFNTFGPLHDWILSGLLWFTDSTAGSPLDPTDSLVIPLGLAAAVWVWRREAIPADGLRMRLGLHLAVVAAVASVATSPAAPPSLTEWFVGIAGDGTLVIEGPSSYFASTDGGLTWEATDAFNWNSEINWGDREIQTPRGRYVIRDTEILRIVQGEQPQVAYSVSYLSVDSNKWAQRYEARRLHSDLPLRYDDSQKLVVTQPLSIVYDESTGNVVVAMRIQGALIGNADGEWSRVGVADFVPTDLSFMRKAQTMFSPPFWASSLATILCLTAVVVVLSQSGVGMASSHQPRLRRISGIALAVFVSIAVVSLTPVFRSIAGFIPYEFYELFIIYSGLLVLVALPFVVAVFALSWPRQHMVRKLIAIAFVVISVLLAVKAFPPFGGAWVGLLSSGLSPLFAIEALLFCSAAFVLYRPSRIQLPAVGIASGTMLVSIVLPFTLWLAGGLARWMATDIALVLLGLTAFRLWRYLRRLAAAGSL